MTRRATGLERALAAALFLALLASLALAIAGRRLPQPLPADAPATLFSAERALPLLRRIARAPHPVWSEEHDCVRLILESELKALGSGQGGTSGEIAGIPLDLLTYRIKGHEPTGTVLCMAHYDSVPTGPGAGDDGVGIVVWLETLRALLAGGWRPRNDILLLFTDGEELGLLGAQLFADSHEDIESIKTVINLEAIGNGGPAVLFELGPRNGPRVRTFANAIDAPTGTSLSDAIYTRMPNDTDLSVFLERGIGGFNLALASGSPAYHSPHDTPANLDPRSLQHMGDCALALVSALGDADLDRLAGPDLTFFDILGRRLVHHSRLLDPLPILLGAMLLLLLLKSTATSWKVLAPAGQRHLVELAVFAAATTAIWWILDALFALFTPPATWVPGNTTSGALLLAALTLLAAGVQTLRASRSQDECAPRLGALLTWGTLALLVLLFMPGASFVLAWPFLLAGLGALAWEVRARRPVASACVLVITLTGALMLTLPILHLLLQLFQRSPGEACFLFSGILASGALLFSPHLRALAHGSRLAGPALIALGLLALVGSVHVARVLAWRSGALLP